MTPALIDRRLTGKLQAFSEALATGCSQKEAATRAGYKSRSAATLAFRNPLVQEYLQVIRNRVSARTGYTVQHAVQEVDKAVLFAYETKSPVSIAKLLELKSKLHGLLIDRVEVVSIDLSGALQQAQHRVLSLVSPRGGDGGRGTHENSGEQSDTRDPSST